MARRVILALALSLTFFVGLQQPVHAVPSWAPAGTASIHPGVQTESDAGQCTSNFVFYDSSNVVYIGSAAHCTGTGGATETDGCLAGSLPLGTQVQIQGATRPGTLVYSSWLAMQAAEESDENACAFNDFGLIRLDPADFGRVNPSVPHWGGPNGINTTGAAVGSRVHSYGNSGLRGGVTTLSPKTGTVVQELGDGWSHEVYTATPGIPGDSGSAFLDASGRALGVLATLQAAPLAGSNGVSDISHILGYMSAHSSLNVTLATGTVDFNGSQVPIRL